MNESNHIVSGIYTSRAEAEVVRERLLERGMQNEQIHIVDHAQVSENGRMADDNEALKDVLVDGTVGAAVGIGASIAKQT